MNISNIRLSKNFTLLDMLYDRDIYTGDQSHSLRAITEEHIDMGTRFCFEVLEPMVERFGPVSVASGMCPYSPRKELHSWTLDGGVAVDVAFHDWVAGDRKAPIHLCEAVDKEDQISFDRLITYSASEFICVGGKRSATQNRYAIHENILLPKGQKSKDGKPFRYQTWGYTRSARRNRANTAFPPRPHWRRGLDEAVFHTQRKLRPQHFRTGRYFVALDFMRSAYALKHGIKHVLDFGSDTAFNMSRVSKYMRMFSEVLDPLVAKYGRVSVARGREPENLFSDDNATLHHWGCRSEEEGARIVFLVHSDYASADDIESTLHEHYAVISVKVTSHATGMAVTVIVQTFEPARMWATYEQSDEPVVDSEQPAPTQRRRRRRRAIGV